MDQNEKGTFCIVIDQQLVTASCPLPKGCCYWKHQQTGLCKYTPGELTVDEFASLVGLPRPDSGLVKILHQTLTHNIRKELSD